MYNTYYQGDQENKNIINLLQHRENNARTTDRLKQNYQFTTPLLKRFGLEKQLNGHEGCVNCLEWSSDGRTLASGSDDTNVRIWDPFRYKCLTVIQTTHIGNIFSVKFLGDGSLIATGAGDCRVIVQSVEDGKRCTPHIDCCCHMGRVKRLAKCPDQPLLFWSAGEDGLVRQYDIREAHKCSVKNANFLDLSDSNDIKCIAVNPTKPHLIAIGANDCYVRLYDRRMIRVAGNTKNDRSVPEHQDSRCVQYFAPGHLAVENSKDYVNKYSVTYVTFNAAGSELLVNMGGEHIYLFDVNNSRHIDEMRIPEVFLSKLNQEVGVNGKCHGAKMSDTASKLMQRNWVGDIYHAARYYLRAIQQSPSNPHLYISFINCLVQLKWLKETESWLNAFKGRFPNFESRKSVVQIEEALERLRADGAASANERSPADGGRDFLNDQFVVMTEREKELRKDTRDFELRFVGHCNTATDIKEANFLGEDGDFICAGSDDGLIFIWDRKTTEVLTALSGDNSIVNCVQPHPSTCFLASSGIDNVVKLWSPIKEDGSVNPHAVSDPSGVIEVNQQRMMDPFDTMLVNIGYRVRDGLQYYNNSVSPSQMCRTS